MVAATPMEIKETMDWLASGTGNRSVNLMGNNRISVLITGIGIHSATYHITQALMTNKYDLVVQAGVAGSFDKTISLGNLVQVKSELFADLGIEDHDTYIDLFETGLADKNAIPWVDGLLIAPTVNLPALSGIQSATGLTVNTVSGCEETIALREQKYGCTIESMEGAALHFVCLQEKVPFIQIRAISNYVIPRDRSQWRMKEAIINLNQWLIGFLSNLDKIDLKNNL